MNDEVANEGAVSNWNRSAAKLTSRTNKDFRKRWSKVCEHIKKRAWNAAEDKQPKKAVEQFGYREWNAQDNEKLLVAVDLCGRNWTTIHNEKFPGRSATDIKNRYVTLNRQRHDTGDQSSSYPLLKMVDSFRVPHDLSDGALPNQEQDYLIFAINITSGSHTSFDPSLAPAANHSINPFHSSDTDYSDLYFNLDNHDPTNGLLDLSQGHRSPSSQRARLALATHRPEWPLGLLYFHDAQLLVVAILLHPDTQLFRPNVHLLDA
ncbi:hypothetical protein MMC11_008810 [Xylographa trunciseda]|nr:hypothetical protein [Xylographa trunciseda]